MPLWEFWVKDSRTNEGVYFAEVVLWGDTAMTQERGGGWTDAAGRLTIDSGTAGVQAFSILKAGYVRIRSTSIAPFNEVRMDSTEVKYTVTFSADAHGNVEPYGEVTVAADTRIKTTATPDVGYVFRAFVVDGKDYTGVNPFNIPIDHDGMSVTATFEAEAEAKAKVPAVPGEVVTKIEVTTVESGGIPWPFSWISGVVNWFGQAWENVSKALILAQDRQTQASIESSRSLTQQMIVANEARMKDYAKPAGLGGWLWGGLSESMSELVKNTMTEALAEITRLVPEATGSSPEWKQKLDATLEPYAQKLVSGVMEIVKPDKYAHSGLSPEEAQRTSLELLGGVIVVEISLFLAHAAAEAMSLGQYEAIHDFEELVLTKLGLTLVGSNAITIPLNELVWKKTQQYYAAQYTPEIPGYGDLQNMRMKEIIGQNEFEDTLKYLGYAPEWARKMWDAHFIPPSLADILTAWRRKIPVRYPKSDPATGTIVWVQKDKLDELDVRYLLESIDLDPRYIDIFETRKYVDPPLSITRFMFEEGVIKADTVHNLVELQGYRPEHVEYITKYITEFQERLWRRRYLVTLQGGYQKGVYTGAELEKAVLDAGYTPDVAHWIIANADARKKIEGSAVVTEEKAKLIGVGDLKKAYVKNMIDADKLRVDLGVRGYQTADVDLLVKLLDEEKVVTSAGGEKIALSVPELKAAYKYKKITEDRVRMELQLRGLSLEEVEILISTWNAQWGVEGEEVA